MAITVCTEDVESYDDKKEKQDCEINAFKHMAPVLKSLMKKYPPCLVGDALYGCDPVWRICERHLTNKVRHGKLSANPSIAVDRR